MIQENYFFIFNILERKKQFEMKRKEHYNEFRIAHSTNKEDEK